MGLLGFLFGGKSPRGVNVEPDKVWLTEEAKFAGLAREVCDRSQSDAVAILLVAHFPDVLRRLEAIADGQTKVPVKAVLAANLSPDLALVLNLDASATIDIIVAERHPLPSADERLEQFAESLPCRCRLSHHLSLDDPLLRCFAGAWLREILDKLGMTEDEAIESRMVSARIRQAQQKIEKKTYASTEADSAADWLAKNCAEFAPK